jgi:O-acetyl-ADP-ribose deacetylase (regulator of RNase III)
MNIVHGDLIALAIEGHFDVIVHGCNCFHAMAGGIAAQIAREFPEADDADRATPYGDRSKLGTLSIAPAAREGMDVPLLILNAYTQFSPGRDVNYAAIEGCFDRIARLVAPVARIGYPMIGAGIAGGDWDRIAKIIDSRLAGMNHMLVVYQPRAA